MNKNLNRIAVDCLYELAGCALFAAGAYNVALMAEFPLTGVAGITMIIYRLFGIKMGIMNLIINIPLMIIGIFKIGKRFMLKTIRCTLILTVMMDYLAPMFPVYSGEKLVAALLSGVLCGAGSALVFMRGSSTGGMDLVLILIQKKFPYVNSGTISIVLGGVVLAATYFIIANFDAIIYGVIIEFVFSVVLDRIMLGLNKGNVAMIVTNDGMRICNLIDEICERGATILDARGGYNGTKKDVVMVAGTRRDICSLSQAVKLEDPEAFTIILDSKEVHGEGFKVTTIAG